MASAGDDGKSTVFIPADAIGVYYVSGELYVIAQGVAYGGTKDIRIEKEENIGVPKFAIKGELDHVAGFEPYCIKYVKKIDVFPYKSIVFEDLEHPLGIVIPIKFFGLG